MIKDLKVIPQDVYSDERGEISSLYHYERTHRSIGTWLGWQEDKLVYANENSLRGLHGHIHYPTAKLITCLLGQVFVAIVDGRVNSPTFGEVNTFWLDQLNRNQIYVPYGCFNGHYANAFSLFHYKWTNSYKGPDDQYTIKWDDPDLGIQWPYREGVIISERDKQGISWREYKEEKLNEKN